eukprot:CAMPEP_0119328578 /NCGR_PEP_ID=MMETSP1333-20130426/73690_1 /TAXON_ID=418940 /ORGANISM="Scyphosphaera apsteinii, Strain RCC1455" /LENGTH=288 /DNA_ID=CAMNT_0007337469 /DNA_START=273 /DNA_END=1136 /DNA_ORIENTATION=-
MTDGAIDSANLVSAVHFERLPTEMLASILEMLQTGLDLLAGSAVCKLWRGAAIGRHLSWRRLFIDLCPFKQSWQNFHTFDTRTGGDTGSYYYHYIRLKRLKVTLKSTWTEKFRGSFQYGKYSRWVCDIENPDFVFRLFFAVRILGLCLPQGFLHLDRATERQYAPIHSTSAHSGGGGWNPMSAEEIETLGVGRDAFLGLQIFHDADFGLMGDADTHSSVDDHLTAWWGGEQREQLLSKLFDVEAFLALAEFVLEDVASGGRGSKLDSLFWDVHGLTVRGIAGVAAGEW